MEQTRNICVVICVSEAMKDRKEIHDVTYGIEEEGIPYIIRVSEENRLEDLARLASKDSQLDVGIGIDMELRAGIYHDKLPEDHLLFRSELLLDGEKARNLGVNAARLVKGIPFKI